MADSGHKARAPARPATATVTAKREDGDQKLVDLECSVANGDGEVKVAGSATALAD